MVIDVAVIELTNKCDLNCKFCPKNRNDASLDFKLFEKLIEENNKLEVPIKSFELCGMGNPLLYENIKEVLNLLHQYKNNITILTNGFNLKDIIAYFDDDILRNVHFCIYLDSADEEKNDYLMGKDNVFDKTVESFEYLLDRNLRYSIFMRINSENYNEIEDMMNICKHYYANSLVPMEVFPFKAAIDNNLLLDDNMKSNVIETINKLQNYKQTIVKNIHFEYPENNCSYLRKKRIFINSIGKLSFCHFLSSLQNTEIVDIKNRRLTEIIEINNNIWDDLLRRKHNEINSWNRKRKNISPCSYCLNCWDVEVAW